MSSQGISVKIKEVPPTTTTRFIVRVTSMNACKALRAGPEIQNFSVNVSNYDHYCSYPQDVVGTGGMFVSWLLKEREGRMEESWLSFLNLWEFSCQERETHCKQREKPGGRPHDKKEPEPTQRHGGNCVPVNCTCTISCKRAQDKTVQREVCRPELRLCVSEAPRQCGASEGCWAAGRHGLNRLCWRTSSRRPSDCRSCVEM